MAGAVRAMVPILGVMALACGPGSPLGGSVLGGTFESISGHADASGDRLSILLADYATSCDDTVSQAIDGSRLVALLLSEGSATAGCHPIPEDPFDFSVTASVTIWQLDAANGPSPAETILITGGKIVLDAVDAEEVSGSAELNTAGGEVGLSGAFTVPVCP